MTTISAHGVEYRINASTNPYVQRALNRTGQPYEWPLLEHIYEQNFTGGAIDVGAQVGNHTLWLAVMCNLRVMAFEPIDEFYEQLVENVHDNRIDDRVFTRMVALGDRKTRATRHDRISIVESIDGDIPVRPLDDYHLDDVSMIKIDVEGFEVRVIRGAMHTIDHNRPVLFIEESTKNTTHDEIARELEPIGYHMTRRWDEKDLTFTPMGRWDPR